MALVATQRPPAQPLDPANVDLSALDQVSEDAWAQLRTRRIYFGHQSVGNDVIAGVEWILQRKPNIGLRVVSATAPGAFSEPGLIHGEIGVNGDVQSKMQHFDSVVRGPDGAELDIAFMKFCYVDLVNHRDAASVASAYRSMVDTIAKDRPGLRLIHSTMPLTSLVEGRKASLQRLLGRTPAAETANVARGTYNETLRTSFERGQIFDIAAVEANAPGAKAVTLSQDGKKWATLDPRLTTDGGHLNRGGQVIAAKELLLLLARQS